MNSNDITYLITKPAAVSNTQVVELEKILHEFPYFQSVRSLYLKGLYQQESFKYNTALKKTAVYTTDRSVLFDFITSDYTAKVQENKSELTNASEEDEISKSTDSPPILISKTELEEATLKSTETKTLNDNEVERKEVIEEKFESALEKSILQSIKEALPLELEVTDNELMEMKEKISWLEDTVETETKTVNPITFNKDETYSFQEWLQLAKVKPIQRDIDTESNKISTPENPSKRKVEGKSEGKLESKINLIDKFINSNPKIPAPKDNLPTPNYLAKKEETPYLMTETLAKIYLEQKKYSKAIQAYEILILKYPEKSSLFANRILEIKDLQQNNNK